MSGPDRPLRFLVFCGERIPSLMLLAEYPLQELARQGQVEYRFRPPDEVSREDIAWSDVVYGIRPATPVEWRIVQAARQAGRRTLAAYDDNLFEVPRDAVSGAFFHSARVRGTLCKILASVDHVVMPTLNLEVALYKRCKEAAIFVCPVPAMLLEMVQPQFQPKTEEEPVVIGFAGGLDSGVYLTKVVAEALIPLKMKYGRNLLLECFGPRPVSLQSVGGRHIPYTASYEEYRRTMAAMKWDIGLAPLFDSPFHRCKYFNKYLEYGALGLPGIYSETHPYKEVIRHGDNGLLVPNKPEAWGEALQELIEDEALRQRLGKNALKDVQGRHQLLDVCNKWKEFFEEQRFSPAPELDAGQVPLPSPSKIRVVRKAQHFWDIHGWNFPVQACRWGLWKMKVVKKPPV
jgi:glycosyltransferase involved in cell wall biosynthesis